MSEGEEIVAEAGNMEIVQDEAPKKRKRTTKLKESVCEIDGEDFVNREMDGETRDRYMDSQANRVKLNAKGEVIGPASAKDHMVDLLLKTMYNSKNQPVPMLTLRKWPASLQSELYEEALDMNALTRKGKEDAKKD